MNVLTRVGASKKAIYIILITGVIFRLLFVFFWGNIYFGNNDFFIQPDTRIWFNAFINLVERGTFTTDMLIEAGKFFRPPGYSFLFGIFYLITFKNLFLASRLLVVAQLLMDTASIYLVYKISGQLIRKAPQDMKMTFRNISALLYACYPFAIVWSPILYAETSSVFFILLSVHYCLKPVSVRTALACGMFAGIATLLRLQCAFILPFIAIGYLFSDSEFLISKTRTLLVFGFGLLITYGLWPARNLLLQNRVMFSQSLKSVGNVWSIDFLSFIDFSHAVSTDFIPTYTEILQNKKVNWPKEAYLDTQDSVLLDSAVQLCRTCGTGFSLWFVSEGLRKEPFLPSACDTVISSIFNSLLEKQKSKNAMNYWIGVPLKNLRKCFFKSSLYGNKTDRVKLITSLLFALRSTLILVGLFGVFIAFRDRLMHVRFLIITICFMAVWYFYLSFFWRNIEIRFLLQCDILLLIPAAYVLTRLVTGFQHSKE